MKCIKCQEEIPPLRLEAVPGTKTCVQCSSTSRWYVRNVISGKTTYAETEVIKDPNVLKKWLLWIEDKDGVVICIKSEGEEM